MTERIVTVTKTASEKLPPDTVTVSVTASAAAKKYADAAREVERESAKLVEALTAAGLDGVRLLGMNVSPARENGKQTGYRAARAMTLKFGYDGEKLAAAVEALADAGCEWRLAFGVENAKCKEQLITRAVKEAKAHAETLAAAAGEKLGSLVGAEYGSSDCVAPVMLRAAYCADNAADVAPESITLSETVTCKFELI